MELNFEKSAIRLHLLLISSIQNFKINSYVINKLFKLQVFCNLKLCIIYKFIEHAIQRLDIQNM